MSDVIPVKELKKLSTAYNLDHVVLFATKGKMQYVSTYGRTIEECDQAAQFGDKLKDGLGWPETLHAMPSRVKKLQKRVEVLEDALKKLLDACYLADMDGDLSSYVDGSLLDLAKEILENKDGKKTKES